MRCRSIGLVLLIMAVLSATSLYGAELFGIAIYEGARLDVEETAFMRKIGIDQGHFYRTGNPVEKVLAFYLNHPGLISLGRDENSGRFVKESEGQTVYVIIDSPWQPSKGGEASRDTRIIVIRE